MNRAGRDDNASERFLSGRRIPSHEADEPAGGAAARRAFFHTELPNYVVNPKPEERPAVGDDAGGAVLRSYLKGYERAVFQYLATGSDAHREHALTVVREMTAQGLPLAEVIAAHWNAARRHLLSTPREEQPPLFERMREIAVRAGEGIAHMLASQRSTQLRLTAAYAQKVREVDALLDSLPALAFLKDLEGNYVAVNQAFRRALDRPEDEILQRGDDALFPSAMAAEFRRREAEALRSKQAVRFEQTFLVEGAPRTFLFTEAPVPDGQGSAAGWVGIGFDITGRKRLEDDLARLAAAIEAAGDAVVITGQDFVVEYVNAAFLRATGYTREEIIGRRIPALSFPDHPENPLAGIEEALSRGEPWRGTLALRRKDGAEIEVEHVVSPVRDAAGRVTSYVSVSRDLTERRQMLESLQRALMVKSEFTAMVSHEMRTPLTAIKEAVDLIADGAAGPINENQGNFLQLARRNVDRLHRLVNQALDFSRLERGEYRLRLGWHDLNALAAEIIEQHRFAAEKRNLRLEQRLEPNLPLLLMDAERIGQVIVNLIGNAISYCDSGWIEAATWQSGGEVILKVQDSGPGIPADKLDYVFEAFSQLSTGPGRRAGGTGLGLSICKQIIQLHGGRIWAESEAGEGSAFYFALQVPDKKQKGQTRQEETKSHAE